MPVDPAPSKQYEALRRGAGLVERPTRARVRVTGRNRLDLLHRMTSQDLKSLPAGEGRTAVLLSDKGRVVDHLAVYALDDELLILSAREDAAPSLAHLKRYTLRDDFRPRDETAATALLQVLGPRAAEVLEAAGVAQARGLAGLGIRPLPELPTATGGAAAPGAAAGAAGNAGASGAPGVPGAAGGAGWLLATDGPCALNFALWVPAAAADAWRERLLASGAAAGLLPSAARLTRRSGSRAGLRPGGASSARRSTRSRPASPPRSTGTRGATSARK